MGGPWAVSNDWVIQGIGDFNGDGKNDILWRQSRGAVAIWLMNGFNVQSRRLGRDAWKRLANQTAPATSTVTARATSCGEAKVRARSRYGL